MVAKAGSAAPVPQLAKLGLQSDLFQYLSRIIPFGRLNSSTARPQISAGSLRAGLTNLEDLLGDHFGERVVGDP